MSKVILITGATSGIGKATALSLAKRNNIIILVGKNIEKGNKILKKLVEETKNKRIYYYNAELSSFKQVIKLSDDIKKQFSWLDVLINNAGAIKRKKILSDDGIEYQWALNYFAPFLLTNNLLDLLKCSKQGRIINVSSEVHREANIDLNDLFFNSRIYQPLKVYAETKLANILFTYHLSHELNSTNVTVNCLHPGVIATGLLADYMGLPRELSFVTKIMGSNPLVGAKTPVYLTMSEKLNSITGRYFVNENSVKSSPQTYDYKLSSELWNISRNMLCKN